MSQYVNVHNVNIPESKIFKTNVTIHTVSQNVKHYKKNHYKTETLQNVNITKFNITKRKNITAQKNISFRTCV
jgi:hypothetical protein